MKRIICSVILAASLAACSDSNPAQADLCQIISAQNSDSCIRLNQIQVLGTHNSYKLAPVSALVDALNEYRADWSTDIIYNHRPLTEQLEQLGIRQFELDVFADPDGGLYAQPAGALLAEDTRFVNSAEMLAPGFKVLHSQDVDYRSICLSLKSCLMEIRDWSFANPAHFPIMIMLEMKDGQRAQFGPITYTRSVAIDAKNIPQIDEEIWSVFPTGRVITPDQVRGSYSSLEEAITKSGWPTLAESRGKVLFALDNTGSHREAYLFESPDLQGRAMFVSSRPGEPTAGFIKMNDVMADFELIQTYVAAGFLVRTRSDIPTVEARSGSTERRDRALASGAQYVSTDYPEYSPFGSGYIVDLPDTDGHARCNPIAASAGCRSEYLSE
jgi:hypothetical protein